MVIYCSGCVDIISGNISDDIVFDTSVIYKHGVAALPVRWRLIRGAAGIYWYNNHLINTSNTTTVTAVSGTSIVYINITCCSGLRRSSNSSSGRTSGSSTSRGISLRMIRTIIIIQVMLCGRGLRVCGDVIDRVTCGEDVCSITYTYIIKSVIRIYLNNKYIIYLPSLVSLAVDSECILCSRVEAGARLIKGLSSSTTSARVACLQLAVKAVSIIHDT